MAKKNEVKEEKFNAREHAQGELNTLAENAGGIIRWVTDDGVETSVLEPKYEMRIVGQFDQPAFYLRAVDPGTMQAHFLKLTQGAATKLGLEWRENAVFGFKQVVTVSDKGKKVRYRVSFVRDLTPAEIAEVKKAAAEADLSVEALDAALESIE